MATARQPIPQHLNAAWNVAEMAQQKRFGQATPITSMSITQTWTDQAVSCYLLEGNCSNCEIAKANYSFACQMKNVVPVLLANLGAPDAARLEKVASSL